MRIKLTTSLTGPTAVAASLLGLVVLLSGCDGNAGTGGNDSSGAAPPAVVVGFVEIQPVSINRTDQLPGRVVSYQVAEIRPQVSGIIQSRLFEEGTYVEEGEKLYQIDPALYEADLQLAQANLADARARLENAETQIVRFEKLIESNAISQQQYDDALAAFNRAKAAVGMAEAEVRIARINLDYTSVHSPISGYISPSSVTKGALVTARQQNSLATVRQLDPVYVDLSQTANEARELQSRLSASSRGSESSGEFPVTLFVGSSGEAYDHKGVLDATDLAVDLSTGAIRLRSIFPNPDNFLLPGMFVRASIEEVGRAKEIIIPQKSVQIGKDGEKSVWILDSTDQAQRRVIRTGASYENNWIVLEGLEAGDRLIVEGTMRLSEGSQVKAKPIDPAG